MAKNITICALLALTIFFAVRLTELENFHYASFVGMCSEFKADDPLQTVKRHNCLHASQTRKNAFWHLFYALRGE
jgi:hypothetical protein